MAAIPVVAVVIVVVALIVWFLYRMGHPRPNEPRFIYRFRRHPSAIPEYLALLSYGLFHPRYLQTGATREESLQSFPGDDLIAKPQWQETRAATINVPPDGLWPWIAQLGSGRGGWYWWTPCEAFPEYAQYLTITHEILPQFQTLSLGDRLSDGGPFVTDERGNWIVRSIEPKGHLVLYAARQVSGGADYNPEVDKPKGIWFVSGWAFVLKPISAEQTRLLIRVRAIGGPGWLFFFLRLILGKGDTVAHHSMLERIKTRAEAFYRRGGSPAPVV